MSQLNSMPSLEVLMIAGRAIALVGGLLMFAWAFRHWRRAALRDTQRVFEQLDLVRAELLIMKEVMHSTAHRQVSEPRSPTPLPPSSNIARGYEIAARLARNGAQKEELMKTCGITTHEAELLVKLHGQKAGATQAQGLAQNARTAPNAVRPAAAAKSPSPVQAAQKPIAQQLPTSQRAVSQPANRPISQAKVTAPAQSAPSTANTRPTTAAPPTKPLMARSRLMAVG